MKVYVLIRCAVYRHEIGGVFSTEEKAKNARDLLVMSEPDDRHNWECVQFDIDKCGEWVLESIPRNCYVAEPSLEVDL